MSDVPDAPESVAPTNDPDIEAAIKGLPPEFYDQPEGDRAIDLALIHTKGNVMLAAQALAIEVKELKQKVKRSKYLRPRWVKEPDRKAPPAPVPILTAAELTDNLDAATAAYQEQLKTIVNDDGQADLGARLFKLQMGHSVHGMALLGGGMQRAAMQLISLIDHLRTHPYPDEYTADGILLRSGQRETDQMILRAQQEYGRRSTEYAQITMMTAKTQQIMALSAAKNSGTAGKPNRKPGFSPMRPLSTQVLAQPGSTVVLQQGGSDGERQT